MKQPSDDTKLLTEPLRAAVADDLRSLAALHDRELDRDAIAALWRDCYDGFLGMSPRSSEGRQAVSLFCQGLTEIPTCLDEQTLEILAAEYADIYLNYGIGVSPCESVWLDDENLAMQEPMFQVRDWYRRYGLAVADWRLRSDDHLVNQLQFLAYLIADEDAGASLAEVARFLDEHLLRWIDAFAERVSERSRTRIYQGLAALTAAYANELRDLIVEVAHIPRPTPDEIEERMRPVYSAEVAPPAAYVPGAGPSW